MKDISELTLLIESNAPIIVLEKQDEKRALELLTRLAMKNQLGLLCRSITEGLNRLGFGVWVGGSQSRITATYRCVNSHQKKYAVVNICAV
jgi:hypothetical protein